MSLQSRFLQIGVAMLLSLLTGCQGVTTVRNVQANPHRNWFTQTVYLQGTVGDRAPLLDGQLYQLKDSTGSIWVLSQTQGLDTGEQIRIRGRVRYQEIEVAGQDLGEVYIEEQQQLELE